MRRLVGHVGADLGTVYGKEGKAKVRARLKGYNKAARRMPWVVLVDLNNEADCAPELRTSWIPDPAPKMCFQVAVRKMEAWLLADRKSFAQFFSIAQARIPQNPEMLADPKRTVVELARYSRRREIREDMVPRSGSGRTVGPAYTSRLIEFVGNVENGWRPGIAAKSSDSLNRCLQRLHQLVEGRSV